MYWNMGSVKTLEKWNIDVKEEWECSKCEQTREMD